MEKQNNLGVPEAEDAPSNKPQAPADATKKINPDLTISEVKHGVRLAQELCLKWREEWLKR